MAQGVLGTPELSGRSAFYYDGRMSGHVLSDTHPMKPVRLRYTYDLLRAYGAFDDQRSHLTAPRDATKEELAWFHTPEYVAGVEALGAGDPGASPTRFNFGPGDNPSYPGMYDAAILSTGASVAAAESLISGETSREPLNKF